MLKALVYFGVARVACSKSNPSERLSLPPTQEHSLQVESLPFRKVMSKANPGLGGKESPPLCRQCWWGTAAHHLFKGFKGSHV